MWVKIKRKIAFAYGALAAFEKVWRSYEISVCTKHCILHVYVFTVLLYVSETWTLQKEHVQRLEAFEMRCYRGFLRVSWQEIRRSTEILQKIQPRSRLMQMIIKHKLGLFVHICQMDRSHLIKTGISETAEGKSKVGRLKRKWWDSLIEWSGVSFSTLTEIAKGRNGWKEKTNVIVGT